MGLLDVFNIGKQAKETLEGAINSVANVADKFIETKEEKKAFIERQTDRIFEDRKNAREHGKDNKMLVKVFAITFLVAYVGLTFYLIFMISKSGELPDFAKTIISMLWGGLTAKINTIVDFLFGASDNSNKK